MFCIKCGKKLSEGTHTCPFCGTAIPDAYAHQEENAKPISTTAEDEYLEENDTDIDAPAVYESENTWYYDKKEEMYHFDIDGYTLSFTNATVIFGNIYHIFSPYISQGMHDIEVEYQQAKDLDSLLNKFYSLNFFENILSKPVQHALSICTEYHEYDITEEIILQTNSYDLAGESRSAISAWELALHPLLEQYQAIYQAAQEEKEYREYQKATRTRLQGGGFGLTGALSAMAKAGAVNLATGAAYSAVNAIGNKNTDRETKKKLKNLLQSPDTLLALRAAYYWALLCIIYFMTKRLGGNAITDKKRQKAKTILENIQKNRIPSDKLQDAILEGIITDPLNSNLYGLYLQHFPNHEKNIERIATLFHVDAELDEYKQKILSAWIQECDKEQSSRLVKLFENFHSELKISVFDIYIYCNGLEELSRDIELLTSWAQRMEYEPISQLLRTVTEVQNKYKEILKKRNNSIQDHIPYAFFVGSNMTSYEVPEGVTVIEEYAFANCTSLATIHFPDSLQQIKSHAFYNCPELEQLTIPKSVKEYAIDAFINNGIVSFTGNPKIIGNSQVPDNFQALFDFPIDSPLYEYFKENELLEHTIIFTKNDAQKILLSNISQFSKDAYWKYPSIVDCMNHIEKDNKNFPQIITLSTNRFCTILEHKAFADSNIIYALVPNTFRVIGQNAFQNSYLTAIYFESGTEELKDEALANCFFLREVILPSSLKKIGNRAFANSPLLMKLTALQMECDIGEDIFEGNCTVVECLPNSDWEKYCQTHNIPYWIYRDENPYAELMKNHLITMNAASTYMRHDYEIEVQKYLENPEGKVTGFFHDDNERKYTSLNQAKINGDGNPNMLRDIILNSPKELKSISTDGLRQLEISRIKVKKDLIINGAFCKTSMIYVDGENDVKYVGENAFYKAKIVAFRALAVEEIWAQAFCGCNNLCLVVLGDKLKSIESKAFADCPNLKTIYIPPTVQHLGEDIFLNDEITVVCIKDSFIERYCKEKNIDIKLIER